MRDNSAELSAVAQKVTLGGSASGLVFGGLNFSELMALISVFIAFAGLLASIYFQRQRNKILLREQIAKQGDKDE